MNLAAFAAEFASHGLLVVGGTLRDDGREPVSVRFISVEEVEAAEEAARMAEAEAQKKREIQQAYDDQLDADYYEYERDCCEYPGEDIWY